MPQKAQQLDKILETLKIVASAYDDNSEEHEAIKRAAQALLFVDMRGYSEEFENDIKASAQPLTEEQIAHLKSMGCSPP